MKKLSERSVTAFRARLRAWYARHKRAMPWRGTRDAYRVWVSEVMLQQTRVAAVEPYYRRFMRRFPTLRALERAQSEEVLQLWAGLGYYSRARNLHRAAREIVAKHGGKFPREIGAALALPGVGRYTAAAVLSIAYGERLAVVDGNVARVVARLEAMLGDLREARRWKRLEVKAQEWMGAEHARSNLRSEKRRLRAALHTKPGEWNQAMMELGATVCTPRAPRCGECPVAQWCEARRMGVVEKIPPARKQRAAEKIEIAAAVLVDARGRTLLVKPEKAETNALFSGMWQFPAVEIGKGAAGELGQLLRELRVSRKKEQEERRKGGKEESEKTDAKTDWSALGAVKHTVTYRELTLRPYVARVKVLPKVEGARVVPLEELYKQEGGSKDSPLQNGNLPAVSSATRKIARAAGKGLGVREGAARR